MTSLNNVVEKSAAQVRAINLELHEKSGKPLVALTGRTFVLRRALWTMGGTYDRDQKTYLMPAHNAVEAQALVDRIGAKIESSMAVAKAKREAKAAEVTPQA